MSDFLWLGLAALLFTATLGYARLCDRA